MAKIRLDHPEARERAAAIEAIARAANITPPAAPLSDGTGNAPAAGLLTSAEWAALKRNSQAAPTTVPKTESKTEPKTAPRVTPQSPRTTPNENPSGDRRGSFPRLEPSGR
jgi:hypothetical protein